MPEPWSLLRLSRANESRAYPNFAVIGKQKISLWCVSC
jgi:hypothetical protein